MMVYITCFAVTHRNVREEDVIRELLDTAEETLGELSLRSNISHAPRKIGAVTTRLLKEWNMALMMSGKPDAFDLPWPQVNRLVSKLEGLVGMCIVEMFEAATAGQPGEEKYRAALKKAEYLKKIIDLRVEYGLIKV